MKESVSGVPRCAICTEPIGETCRVWTKPLCWVCARIWHSLTQEKADLANPVMDEMRRM